MPNQVQYYRERAFRAVFNGIDDETFCKQDYEFDDFARILLRLPKRPDRALPYMGWLPYPTGKKQQQNELSNAGLDFIKQWEGCKLSTYKCSAGVDTIGYGHTKTAKPGQTITLNTAEELLKLDVREFVNAVNTLVTVPLTQNQFDALVSFTFNVGINGFKHSTLLTRINQNNVHGAALEFGRWVNAGGKQVTGLVRRREAEKELFLRNDY